MMHSCLDQYIAVELLQRRQDINCPVMKVMARQERINLKNLDVTDNLTTVSWFPKQKPSFQLFRESSSCPLLGCFRWPKVWEACAGTDFGICA